MRLRSHSTPKYDQSRTSKYDLSQTQKKLHLKYDFKVRPKLYLFQVRPRSTFFEFDFGHTTIMYDQSRTSKYAQSQTQKKSHLKYNFKVPPVLLHLDSKMA